MHNEAYNLKRGYSEKSLWYGKKSEGGRKIYGLFIFIFHFYTHWDYPFPDQLMNILTKLIEDV